MYQIKDCILYKDGKKTFFLGQSYYPSFHPCKFPVKPEDDRLGEMIKDLKMMAEAGFDPPLLFVPKRSPKCIRISGIFAMDHWVASSRLVRPQVVMASFQVV